MRRKLPTMPPLAKPPLPDWKRRCVKATKRWSATKASAASSRPKATATSPSTPSVSLRPPNSTASPSSAPMRRSRRWLSRSAIARDGSWRIFSGPQNPSSIRARSFTSAMIRFAAMCSVPSLLCCCARNSSTVSPPMGVAMNGPISFAISINSFKLTSIKPAEGFVFAPPLSVALAPCSRPSAWRCRRRSKSPLSRRLPRMPSRPICRQKTITRTAHL